MDDLERYKEKINKLEDSSLDSTRNMLAMMEEVGGRPKINGIVDFLFLLQTQVTGAGTLQMLDEQGQQLDKVEGNLNTINAEMKQAEKTLTKMEKWCGLFTCPWNRYDIQSIYWDIIMNVTCYNILPVGVSRQVQMTVSGRREEGRGQEKVPGPGQEAETPWTQRSKAGLTSRSE